MSIRHGFNGWQKRLVLATGVLASNSLLAQQPVDADTLVLGRYTSAQAQPPEDMAEPLAVVVSMTFPRATVTTVGDALRHALMRSGYRLAMEQPGVAADFLALPLPESQRQVGAYRLMTILEALTGPAWDWHSDRYRRTVWFTQPAAQAPAAALEPRLEQAQAYAVETPAAQAIAK
jgi:type IV pili sensor histidine kinase/response regulator